MGQQGANPLGVTSYGMRNGGQMTRSVGLAPTGDRLAGQPLYREASDRSVRSEYNRSPLAELVELGGAVWALPLPCGRSVR